MDLIKLYNLFYYIDYRRERVVASDGEEGELWRGEGVMERRGSDGGEIEGRKW